MSTSLCKSARVSTLFIFMSIMILMFFGLGLVQAQSLTTVPTLIPFEITKNISDNIQPDAYTADQFSFTVVGNGYNETVSLSAFTADTAVGTVNVPEGTYTVTEVGPADFVAEDWTVQWSGYGCENKNTADLFTTMTVSSADDPTANVCRADNQWRGSTVLGCTDINADNYEADATQDDNSCTYTLVIPGCTDNTANNYDVDATLDDGSCTFDTPALTYLIDGYVWNDVNEDGVIDEGEEYLENWELQVVNGSTTMTTVSDAGGYFSFSVTDGTWVLSEVLEDGWAQVFPTPITYTIVAPDDFPSEELTLGFPFNLFVNIAQAQSVVSGGPYNFGNVVSNGGGGGNNGNPLSCSLNADKTTITNGDATTLDWNTTGATVVSFDNSIGTVVASGTMNVSPDTDTSYVLTAINNSATTTCSVEIQISKKSGGGGCFNCSSKKNTPSSGSGTPKSKLEPIPQVLGEQVSIIPLGAPDTGAGGASSSNTIPFVLVFLTTLSAITLFLTRRKV